MGSTAKPCVGGAAPEAVRLFGLLTGNRRSGISIISPGMTPKPRRPTRSDGKASKHRSILWRWRRGLFAVWLVLVALASGLVYVVSSIELPEAQVQAFTSFVCGIDVQQGCNGGNAIARLSGEQDRDYVSLDEVAPVLIEAVLASEDRDFYAHAGIDPVGIMRAAWTDIRGGDFSQGGSTITQQYVKNVYLSRERTITRKVREAVLAMKLERELSKDEILERYLNTIYLGRGAYGVSAAAQAYFGKGVGQLDLAEAAYLAGLIRAPEGADAVRQPEEATRRRRTVLVAMRQEDYIDGDEYEAAAAEPWVVATLPDGSDGTVLPRTEKQGYGQVRGASIGTDYFVDYVYQQLTGPLGFTESQVYSQGLRVYTTIDLTAQQAAWDAVTTTLPDAATDPLASLVAVDDSGFIRAMIGGRDYRTTQFNLAVPNRGTRGQQAGSAMKPFVLATAVKQGISLQSKFLGPAELVLPRANAGEDWTVHNYAESEQGLLTVLDATRVSSNTAYAQLMLEVGPENVVEMAQQMGITSPLDAVNALVLGTEEVYPLEMASAFSTFANEGTHIAPTAILRVEDSAGDVLWSTNAARTQVLTPAEDVQVVHALRQVIAGGTGSSADFGKPAAGKTGTTQDYLDAWFVGFTPNGWTAAVWMGYDTVKDENGEDQAVYMDDVRGRQVTGGSFPADIWRRFMSAWTDGVDVGSFTPLNRFTGTVLNPDLDTTTTTLPPCPPDTSTTTTAPCETTTTTTAPTTTTESTTTTLPPTTPPPTTLPPCGTPPTTTDPTQPCDPGVPGN
ncbi:MAG: transglycosylase domain-containing protein, partial [Acidimicrobiales bacterium]